MTSRPIERAAPATIAIAESIESQLRSGILISAILRICALVTLPTLLRFGWPDPFSMPASFFKRIAAGGVLRMKVNDLSEKIVTSTGRIMPGWLWVRELNSFTNAMMLIPCGPSAVPTGGAGVACPAGICNFTNPVTFFAIHSPLRRRRKSPRTPTASFESEWSPTSVRSQLQVVQFNRCRPAEEAHRHPHLAFVHDHFFHRSIEIGERPFRDRDSLTDEERDLLFRLFRFLFVGNAEQPVHFVRTQRLRKPILPDELDHALDRVDGVNRLLIHRHLDQHVSRIKLPFDVHLLAVLDLDDFLRGHERLPDGAIRLRARVLFDLPLDQRANLVLVTSRRLDGVPSVLEHQHQRKSDGMS